MRALAGHRPEPILFVALAFLWGSSYLVVHLAGTEVGPFTLVGLRLVIGVLDLAAVAGLLRTPLPDRRAWPHLVVVGALGIAIPFSLITWSQRSVDSGLASIIIGATPLLSALIVAGTTRDDGLGPVRLVGLGLGFVGVVLVAGGGIGSGGDPLAIGGLLLAAVAYAANGAYTRRSLAGTPPLAAALGQSIGALAIIGVLAVVIERPALVMPSPAVLWASLWLGLLPSAVGPLIFFRLIAAWGVTRTTMVNYLAPVVGVSAGILVAGERPVPALLVGGAIVIVGVILANASPAALVAVVRPLGMSRPAARAATGPALP
jgi:drug/metabolite transporter (DMT)-like permease